MQKIGFPAMKSLDQIRSMAAGSAKNLSSFSSRQPHDSVSSGNFSNLKFTAETGEGTGFYETRSRIGGISIAYPVSFYTNLSLIDVLESLGLCFFDLESLLSIPIAYPVSFYTNLSLIDVLKRIVLPPVESVQA
ncbi:hypothetical protein YC2023_078498 [Brassica napus]